MKNVIKYFFRLLVIGAPTIFPAVAQEWPMSGGAIDNMRSVKGSSLNVRTIGRLQPAWEFRTAPDTGDANTPIDAVGSTPVVDGDFIYFVVREERPLRLRRDDLPDCLPG